MSGFDNGTLQGGIFFQVKQFGSILRGLGPPAPQAGLVGDLYIDTQTFQLFNKRSTDSNSNIDPWGHYLFVVPVTYQTLMKWFGAVAPTADIGVNGDYYLAWAGYSNYGMQPSIYGPKAAGAWPANPANVAVTINTLYTAQDQYTIGAAITGSFAPVRVATTGANIVLSGLLTIDGVALIANDRVLAKDQTSQPANGIYVAAVGAWARATDASLSAQWYQGALVLVNQGTANVMTQWVMVTVDPIVLGTSNLVWSYKP